MAGRGCFRAFTALGAPRSPAAPTIRRPRQPSNSFRRLYSSVAEETDAPPPLLQKLKGDLKTAMRAKDAPRLSVLRSLLSATLNASKTASPIKTDPQLVALIRKTQRASQDAADEFRAANRQDLVDKEEGQIQIMEEYISGSGVQALGEAELKTLIQNAVDQAESAGVAGKALIGAVMRSLKDSLDGKDVDRTQLANMVKEMTS
jgi:uncharacterized protein